MRPKHNRADEPERNDPGKELRWRAAGVEKPDCRPDSSWGGGERHTCGNIGGNGNDRRGVERNPGDERRSHHDGKRDAAESVSGGGPRSIHQARTYNAVKS